MELTEWTALELGAAIKRGEISVAEAVQAALERIAAWNPALNAYITVTGERALDRAARLQAGVKAAESLLYGVPMALKDNICTRGVRTTCASRMLEEFVPPYNAAVVDKLADAGAVSLGKLNMDEFAMGSTSETSRFGPVKNPWDLSRVPGGSSGGAAAAVAAGLGWYAVGSDTGGSIRQPAAHCGLTGIKPTYGTVSRYGLIAYASSLDQVGPLCRDAADCAAVLDLLQGFDRRDATSLPGLFDRPGAPGPRVDYGRLLDRLTGDIRGLRVGLPVECFGEGLDGAARAAVRSAAEVLKDRGAELVELSLPVMKYVVPAYYVIAAAEASSNLSRYDGVKYGWRADHCQGLDSLVRKTRTQGFGPEVRRRILLGTFVLSAGYYDAYYLKALRARALIKEAFHLAFQRCGLLLTPVAPAAAPKLGDSLGDPLQMYLGDVYTLPANLAGLPALSMPCGFDNSGLPLGVQLLGPHFGESTLLNAAHACQLDTDWHKRRPSAQPPGSGADALTQKGGGSP